MGTHRPGPRAVAHGRRGWFVEGAAGSVLVTLVHAGPGLGSRYTLRRQVVNLPRFEAPGPGLGLDQLKRTGGRPAA